MKILITGSSGFLGQHLCERLKKHEIFKLKHDEFNDKKLMKALGALDIDYIYHLAAYGNFYNQDDEAQTLISNYSYLYRLLSATKDIKYKAFINISTSSVTLPHQTFYSATKMGGEYLVKAFVRKYDKPVVNVRPFTIYGEGDSPQHLIPTLFRSALRGEKMPFVEYPTHDYIHVSDIIRGLIFIAHNAQYFKGQSVELGNGKAISNKRVRLLIERITGKKCNIEDEFELRDYDNRSWRSKQTILKLLGWEPKVTLKEGLIRCYKSLRG